MTRAYCRLCGVCVQVAYVDGLQGPMLFDALFVEDSDAERIALLPGTNDMLKQ